MGQQTTFAAQYNFIVKEDHRNGFQGEPTRWSIHMSPHDNDLNELKDGELYFSLKVGTTREGAQKIAEQLRNTVQEVCFFDHSKIKSN